MNKRDFLKKTVTFLPYIAAGSLLYPAANFILFNDKRSLKLQVPLKDITSSVQKVKNYDLFIVKNGEKVTVFDAHCTHMGCILRFDETKDMFACPCHKSTFDKKGKRLGGPAKRDLDKIAFTLKKDMLHIG